MNLVKTLQDAGFTRSMSEGRRLIHMEAIKVNGKVVSDLAVEVKQGDVIQVGKSRQMTVN